MPAGIPSFQLLDGLINTLLEFASKELVSTFAEAAGVLPSELPVRATFGPEDEGMVVRAVRASFVRAGVERLSDTILNQFGTAMSTFTAAPSFEVPADALRQLSNQVLSSTRAITDAGQRVEADVRRVLALAVREPLTAVQMADQLRGSMGAQAQWARSTIETELKAAQRGLAVNVGVANNWPRLYYAGLLIPTSRLFCRLMHAKAYTVEMLAACDNGMGLDPVLTLGGWGCIHSLFPASVGAIQRQFPGALVLEWEEQAQTDGKLDITVVKVLKAA